METLANIATVIAGITTVIAVFITIHSLRTSIDQFKEQLQLSVFTDYTKRYQEIMLNFPESINEDDFDFNNLDKNNEKSIKEKTLRYMRAYFDLCSEEYFLHSQGKIGDNTWREWESGIEYAFSKTAFIKGWRIISLDTGYYPDFVKFVNKVMFNKNMIDQTSLIGGDIILCYGDGKKDLIAKGIEKVTGSKYKHAAICLDAKDAAESGMSGVSKESIKNIIRRYDHVAIFRQPDAWSQDRVNALNLFIKKTIETGAKYNFKGIKSFSNNKNEHNDSIYQKLDSYFKGELKPKAIEKGNYFCSELVVNCLTATGFITPSAAVFYKGDTFSPVDLGKDPTFGTFVGFITSKNNYQIPETDDFYHNTAFHEIFKKHNK